MKGNFCKESTVTAGTVLNVALTAIPGWTRLSDVASIAVGETFEYTIFNGLNKEVGTGTKQAGNTFDRTTPIATLEGGIYDETTPTRINLVGDSEVFVTISAENVFDKYESVFVNFLQKSTATLNGTAIDNHINLGGGASITGTAAQAYDYCTVSGGDNNQATREWSTVGGGRSNVSSQIYAVISGGFSGAASGSYSFIGGGFSNESSASKAAVVCGGNNTASGASSFIGSGDENIASGLASVVVGGGAAGVGNEALSDYSFVGGGYNNVAGDGLNPTTTGYACISGGRDNEATHEDSFVGGGQLNNAIQALATVGGGYQNTASAPWSVIAGGYSNSASGAGYSAICGGQFNVAGGNKAFVGGGLSNSSSGTTSGIASGDTNTSSGIASFVGGGANNDATGDHSVIAGGGDPNAANGNTASGTHSSVLGGRWCSASATFATVGGGSFCSANGTGGFVGGGGSNVSGTGTYSAVGGGLGNQITAANYATVPGGRGNNCQNNHSMAAGGGSRTRANFDFVWGATDTGTPNVSNNTFRLQGTGGNILIDGSVSSPEADVAECIEWKDGNPSKENRDGYFVSLVEGKIVIGGTNIVGIISAAPSVISNAAPNHWRNLYLIDKFRRKIKTKYTLIEWTDESGEPHTVYEAHDGTLYDEYPQPSAINGRLSEKTPTGDLKKSTIYTNTVNPDYDDSKAEDYKPRNERPEWGVVGVNGQIPTRTSEKITGWKVEVDAATGKARNATTDGKNVYDVIEIIDDETITVFFK